MNSKSLGILLVVTAVLLVAAVIAYSSRSTPVQRDQPELLYEGLTDRVNDVTALTVVGNEETFRIVRAGSAWGLEDKGGYPVEFEKVKQTVVGMSRLRILEPKTSRPEQYAKLGVNDPREENATSTLVTLEDAGGETLASLILGERDFAGRQARRFVRKNEEASSWLVEGRMDVDAEALNWVDRNFLRLAGDRVSLVSITHPDGECVVVFRDEKGQRDLDIADIPEGREPSRQGIANPIGSALSFIRLEDVAPVDSVGFAPDQITVAEFRTFDGLVVQAETIQIEDQVWARFKVSFEEPAAAAEEPEAGEEEEGADTPPDEAEEAEDPVRSEAEELQKKLAPWTYQLSEAQAESLRKRLSDLTKEIEPKEPESGPELTAPAAGTGP